MPQPDAAANAPCQWRRSNLVNPKKSRIHDSFAGQRLLHFIESSKKRQRRIHHTSIQRSKRKMQSLHLTHGLVGQNSQNTHAIFSFWNSISKQCSIRRRRTFQTSFQPAPQDTCTRRKSIVVTRLLLKKSNKTAALDVFAMPTVYNCLQATKLQHKSSVPYNDPNGTSFFPPLLMISMKT